MWIKKWNSKRPVFLQGFCFCRKNPWFSEHQCLKRAHFFCFSPSLVLTTWSALPHTWFYPPVQCPSSVKKHRRRFQSCDCTLKVPHLPLATKAESSTTSPSGKPSPFVSHLDCWIFFFSSVFFILLMFIFFLPSALWNFLEVMCPSGITLLWCRVSPSQALLLETLHRSGRLMMGTHWSMHRLSLQNRLTLLRAGSFQDEEWGLCKVNGREGRNKSSCSRHISWYLNICPVLTKRCQN